MSAGKAGKVFSFRNEVLMRPGHSLGLANAAPLVKHGRARREVKLAPEVERQTGWPLRSTYTSRRDMWSASTRRPLHRATGRDRAADTLFDEHRGGVPRPWGVVARIDYDVDRAGLGCGKLRLGSEHPAIVRECAAGDAQVGAARSFGPISTKIGVIHPDETYRVRRPEIRRTTNSPSGRT